MKALLWNIIASGLPSDYDLKQLRRIIMLNLITILGTITIIPLAVIAFLQGNPAVGFADIIVFSVLNILLVCLRKTLRIDLVAYTGTIITGIFFLFLIANGGTGKAAHIWSLAYPLIALFLLGIRSGLVLSLVYFFCMGILFFIGSRIPLVMEYPVNLIIRVLPAYLIIFAFAYVMEKVRELVERRLTRVNRDLQEKIDEIHTLRGILPICASCKKIRDDKGYWHQVETYLHDRSLAEFTHGICPECTKKLYPELSRNLARNNGKEALPAGND